MRNIKLTIEYAGTGFHGWQIQEARSLPGNSKTPRKLRTVQGELEKTLQKILNEPIRLIGSGRTDSGVHALGQVANFKTRSKLTVDQILKATNARLPEDIAVLAVEEVRADFHAQYRARSKVYRYTILNRQAKCALSYRFCLWYPHSLNLTRMRREAKALIGKKDFKSFQCADPSRGAQRAADTIRTIKRLTIKRRNDFIDIDIEADGFLYKMVRSIVGSLLEVGRGAAAHGHFKKILQKRDRRVCGQTVPAKGLCLLAVHY
ncbi:MAG: tRNA pseudouridine(38-40) synthase TruA [Candidatus Omnitrophota bacterium]